MKPYFDMGLRQLAHTSGYPVAAIQSCSQFKRTHHFLMEAWQAFYQVMVQRFLEYDTESGNYTHTLTDIVQDCVLYIKTDVTNFRTKLIKLRQRIQEASYSKTFQSFLCMMEEKDLNWKFWKQFVFVDALA